MEILVKLSQDELNRIVSRYVLGVEKQISITIEEAPKEEAPKEAFQCLSTLVQDEDGWFLVPEDHGESRCPIDGLGKIEVQFRCGDTEVDFPNFWALSWVQEDSIYDIVKFRSI